MKILLINNNPVVSRLTALSARKEDIKIDEIQEVTELNSANYDIVFVDADSWTKDVRDVISENLKTQKSVLFYADGDDEEKGSFDISILKPFLPSEVSAVIRSVEASSIDLEGENHLNIVTDSKVEAKSELFDLDGLDALDGKKEEHSLILDDDLELNNKFDEKLEEAFSLNKSSLDDDLLDDSDLFDLDLKDETSSLDKDLFAEEKKEDIAMVTEKFDLEDDTLTLMDTPKEEELISSKEEELLSSKEENFSLDLDELLIGEEKINKEKVEEKVEEKKVEVAKEETKEKEIKKETKILDELEIENIKGILTEDISDEITLDELMTPVAVMPSVVESTPKEKDALKEELKIEKIEIEKKEEKREKKSDNIDDALDFDTNVLSQTLAAMPVENLRELLSGAKVNITIKFPKSKK